MQKSTESIRRVMSPADPPGMPPVAALFAIAFGGVLALFAAFMFFAIEGWPFALLSVSQMFIAFGAVSYGRRLHRELGGRGGHEAAPRDGGLHS